jgi:hypothetical protein
VLIFNPGAVFHESFGAIKKGGDHDGGLIGKRKFSRTGLWGYRYTWSTSA